MRNSPRIPRNRDVLDSAVQSLRGETGRTEDARVLPTTGDFSAALAETCAFDSRVVLDSAGFGCARAIRPRYHEVLAEIRMRVAV
jgi:hypothetical protein